MKQILFLTFCLVVSIPLWAQPDSIQSQLPVKISHAEPLYVDLIRDLGARKGEREWNVGYGMEGHPDYAASHAFVEFEFSPVNRLGLEVEVPFSFYTSTSHSTEQVIPRSRMEGIKLASQYTFLVSPKNQLSMAAGYMHEFRMHSFYSIERGRGMLKGNSLSPFLIIAKKFGNRVNTMIYTGPEWEITPEEKKNELFYQLNISAHYVLAAGHFVGVEVNDELGAAGKQLVVRPQVKLKFNKRFALGLVTGIPVSFKEHGMSFMTRIIFEP